MTGDPGTMRPHATAGNGFARGFGGGWYSGGWREWLLRDGTSKTIFVGERCKNVNNGNSNYSYIAVNNPVDQWGKFCGSTGIALNSTDTGQRGWSGFSSNHNPVVNFVMIDGSVTSVAESIDPNIYAAKGTRNRRDKDAE